MTEFNQQCKSTHYNSTQTNYLYSQSVTDPTSLPTRQFFAEYRLAIGHVGFAHGKIPKWDTPEEWKSQRSTKWGHVADLLHHILANDETPYPVAKTVTRVDPDTGKTTREEVLELPAERLKVDPLATRKVVLYVEFTKTLEHLEKVSTKLYVNTLLSIMCRL